MKEEEGRHNAVMEAFNVAERSIQELKRKLQEEERERKSAATALDSTEKQAEGQRVLFCNAEDQLAASKTQIVALKKKLKEAEKARELAEKARDQAKQVGYDLGVAETEEAPRVEVSRVCRNYCSQIWNKALNQAGVEALSVLRKAKSVYFPPTIRESIPFNSRINTPPEMAKAGKDSSANAPTSFDKPPEEAE